MNTQVDYQMLDFDELPDSCYYADTLGGPERRHYKPQKPCPEDYDLEIDTTTVAGSPAVSVISADYEAEELLIDIRELEGLIAHAKDLNKTKLVYSSTDAFEWEVGAESGNIQILNGDGVLHEDDCPQFQEAMMDWNTAVREYRRHLMRSNRSEEDRARAQYEELKARFEPQLVGA